MISYLCDNTFEGLLTAIYFAYKEKQECRVLSGQNFQNTLSETLVEISADHDIYSKMETYIYEKCGSVNLMNMYKAYLGETPGSADLIFRYFKTAVKMKDKTIFMHADPTVAPVLKSVHRVTMEAHKMQGFIRFKKLDCDLMYSSYAPSSNTTPLVAPHFADRMNSYNWIIHDTKRNVFAVYNKKECIIGTGTPGNIPRPVDIDADFEELWRSYTVHAAIKERFNPKLQMSFMPKKYWHFLTEVNSNKL